MVEKSKYDKVLAALQNTWILCFGTFIVLIEAGYFINPFFLPFLALALAVVVWGYGTHNLRVRDINCSLMTHYTIYVLIVSGIVMLVFNLLNTRIIGQFVWHQQDGYYIKYIPPMVVFPIATILYGIGMLRRSHTEYCEACKAKAGFSLWDALERNVFHVESKLQIRTSCLLSLLISIVDIVYFKLFYIDVNFNSPDTFYFFIVPLAVYLLSVGYFVGRISSMKFELNMEGFSHFAEHHSIVRFMVVRGDQLLLEEITLPKDGKLGLWDTPATHEMPHQELMSMDEAKEIFAQISGTDNFELKYLFSNNTVADNSFHYAAFLPEDGTAPGLDGDWLTLYEVDEMLKSGLVCRPFAYEMHRVFTITMAWKTYDRNGKRLYPIKKYRPSFRLSDFKNWDVDYNDLRWINVSRNNEDSPFFRLRTFWRRYVTGIENKWGRNN